MRMKVGNFTTFANNTISEINQLVKLLDEHEIEHNFFSIADISFSVVVDYLNDIASLAIARNDAPLLRLLIGLGVVKGELPPEPIIEWPRLPRGDDNDACACQSCSGA